MIMSLILTGCGQAVSNVKTQFKLNGIELMETTYCVWQEPTFSAALVIREYSTGSVDKNASMSMPGLEEYHTLPINDQPVIYYIYYNYAGVLTQGALVGDDTVCRHQFYDYK